MTKRELNRKLSKLDKELMGLSREKRQALDRARARVEKQFKARESDLALAGSTLRAALCRFNMWQIGDRIQYVQGDGGCGGPMFQVTSVVDDVRVWTRLVLAKGPGSDGFHG